MIFIDELLDNKTIKYISNRYRNDLLKKIKKLELDTSHFKEYTTKKVDLDEKLVENKKYESSRLKELLYKEGIKEEKCEACGIGDIWDGMRICLQLDHINGNHEDNRIENIRIVCPICHAQTNTYCIGIKQANIRDIRLKIFKYDDDKFKEDVAKSKNYRNLIRLIFKDELLDNKTIKYISNCYKNDLLKKIEKLGLDTSHFRAYTTKKKKFDLTKVLVENKEYKSSNLKLILYREQIKEEKCEKCGIGPEYNGLPFAMHLDHINGNHKDNRIENLRILCPNCHSQTNTYSCGQVYKKIYRPLKEKLLEDIKQFKTITLISEKNNVCERTMLCWIKEDGLYEIYEEIYKSSREPKKEYKCSNCNKEITRKNKSGLCKDCKTTLSSKNKCSKCNKEITSKNKSGLCNDCTTKRPSKEQLLDDLKEFKTIIAIAKKYGVSDNGVNKWIKKYEITNFKSILLNLEKN